MTIMTADILKTYLRRLTNLSTRNRSLLLTNLSADQFLDWQDLDFIDNRSSFDLLKDVLAQKKNLKLCPILDSRSEKANEISKRLRKIARTERFIEEERGSEDLYVAYPFVRGKLMDGTVIHAPLAFFPVTLNAPESIENGYWQLHRRDEPASLNRSFLLAYGHFNQVKISDELLEKSLDELGRDALVFRTELYELLKESTLEINFNKELFQDKLQYFDAQSKPDLELLELNGELKLYSEAVLGIFPQAGSYLGPDYENLIDLTLTPPFAGERLFRQTSRVDESTPRGEANTFTAFAQDASQEKALMRVKNGESLVVQGPPGTGKSQLIANLMTDFAARGKRVLLVCQKRVALDVVFERLQQVGCTSFVALVHDFKNDRAALYGQLDHQIENIDVYQKQNYSLDAIVLEREFLQVSRSIEQIIKELETFKEALFDTTDCGLSAKELYLTSNPIAAHVSLPQFRSFCFDEKLNEFLQKLNRFEQYQSYLHPAHPWYSRVNFAIIDFKEISQIKAIIEAIPQWSSVIEAQTVQIFGKKLSFEELQDIQQHSDDIQHWLERLNDEAVWGLFQKRQKGFFTKSVSQWFQKWEKTVSRLSKEKMIGDEVPTSELHSFSLRLDQLITARNSVIKWLFYADKEYFRYITSAHSLTLELNDLYQLKQLLQHRQEWEAALTELEEKLGVDLFAEKLSTSKVQVQAFFQTFAQAEKAFSDLQLSYTFLTPLFQQELPFTSLHKKTTDLLSLSNQTAQKYQSWKQYLTHYQIIEALHHTSIATELQTTLSQDFEILVETDRLVSSFSNNEWEVCHSLKTYLQDKKTSLVELFQNSLRLAWLSYIEEKNPVLRSVSSFKMSQLEEELQAAIGRKRALSKEILLMQLREQTYKNVEFNRLQNRTTYRDLQHQVTKKRKIWPVRKLMEQHSDEVFRLVPCWMASPETVSAVFPLTEGLFDLVIFDEASQCYAEYGVPAIYRAKQTVVVGDSKQLTPYDLYRIRYESETEEESPALEVESLLDLAKQYLPEALLQGHYRSRSLDLIDFSNQNFYKNKLQFLPDFEDINASESSIEYVKVAGVWENNRNQVEAEKVAELLLGITQKYPQSSVGVVTFNQPQQQLIENTLTRTFFGFALESATIAVKGLFVKNIENVQGDERDIIIFSVGYAPDLRGKLRAQFGSLNAQGGENRLNVAVTRARQKVYVVTSILPEQLQVEESLHPGPKLLKKYLQYALEVSEGLYTPKALVSEQYRSEWLLKHQMMKISDALTNHKPTIELPFADLTIKNGDFYKSVILTDDDLYQEAISVKESHAYLPLLLRIKGWRFERVWSREWWRKK